MDDEISIALSRLLLASGGSKKAKEYLDAYIDKEDPLDAASISTVSSGSVESTPAILPPLPPLFLTTPTTNPWGEVDGHFSPVTRPAGTMPHFDTASSHFFESSPPSTPIQPQSKYLQKVNGFVHGHPSLRDALRTPSPTSTVSILPPTSDQPQPSHHTLPTPTKEEGPNRCYGHGLPFSPTEKERPNRGYGSPLSPTKEERPNRSYGSPLSPTKTRSARSSHFKASDCLHPDLAAVRSTDSLLPKRDFEAVKLKIRSFADYVGELPYIKVMNPQYSIKTLVHAPPKRSVGKWYMVSKGRAIGIFNNWDSAANATQGVSKAIHKSFAVRGEAIVAYQVTLLKGEVLLMNEREDGED